MKIKPAFKDWNIEAGTSQPRISLSTPLYSSAASDVYKRQGMWFFASAAGNYVAGLIARATSSESSSVSGEVYNLAQKQSFIDVYTDVGLMAIGCGIVLALITPLLKKLMHGSS